ncbi:hypothetical protein D0Y65_045692 [Glycine soja]|uniref:Uncharacterized protein n=1 Tax=Glycine soja TaxID=3848 RepID=A0A445G669_GLYSO|nr:hypothetical protein D0Y65_045692 [Glycine soja]
MGTNSEEHGGSGKPNVVIPPQIIAEAISMIHDIDIRDDGKKSPRGTLREPLFGNNLPEMDWTQLETSTLLDILNKKSSFPGSFISIPEIQAQNKVLKHCGLPDDEYLVLFTPSYKDAMMLVGESYPFVKGNYYMTNLGEEKDYIREFDSFKESKMNGTKHWVSEAQRNYWRVLLDASALVLGKGRLYLGLHRPDFLVCCLDNTHSNPSRITCLLVRTKSFDTSTASSQVNG